ncbi:MAG: IS4 family transposase [Woeseiaceae bacterium]
MHPSERARVHQQRGVRQQAACSDAYTFFNVLTEPELFETLESLLPEHRERLFPPTETLSMFLAQALNADRSCQRAVNESAVKRLLGGLPHCSTHTGGYCRARLRLPLSMVAALTRESGRLMAARLPRAWHWQGRPVRLVDGTTVTMPDSRANQTAYPHSRSQKPGLGFPLCRLAGILCLGSGAILNAAIGRYQGKGSDEQTLLRSMLDTLASGDLLLGDAYYASYFLLCALQHRGVDGVFEQHAQRRRCTDFRRGRRLGSRDHLLSYDKPRKPHWMSQSDYDAAPASLTVRELYAAGKILVTTLLCPKQTPKNALKELYRKRWHIELDLRNIKTTLGMEQLSCKSPAMAEKELWVYLLAYNLLRLLMAQAALQAGCLPRQLSFKHTLQLWLVWRQHVLHGHHHQHLSMFFLHIAQQRVGQRPGRREPRAVKRRPKQFPLLMKPRLMAKADLEIAYPRKIK